MTSSRRLAALALCLISAGVSAQQRDSFNAPRVGTAVVSGVVMSDEATPQPLRRAQITLMGTEQNVVKNVFTDGAGRFVVPDLPPGRYSLAATKGGYVRMAYGAKRHDRPGTPLNLTEGQKLSNLAIRLPRGGAITGRILDENGGAAAGVQVRLLQYRTQLGERMLMPAVGGNLMGETTDDRGVYRLYGLPAGEYIVAASPRNTNAGEIRASTEAEIRAALAAAQQPATPAPPAGQLPPPKDHVTVGFAPVYFPGTTSVGGAATVALGPGEERTGMDFALQLVRTAKIEGMVVVPSGFAPQSVTLTMVPAGPHVGPGIMGPMFLNRVTPGPDGKFSYAAVPPGQYTISARLAGAAAGGARGGGAAPADVFEYKVVGGGGAGATQIMTGGAQGAGPAYWAIADVTADGTPQNNVLLTLQPGLTITGRLEFKGTRLEAPTDFSRVRVNMTPAPTPGAGGVTIGIPSAQVDASGKFTVTGVTPGRYNVNAYVAGQPGAGPGLAWILQSAVFKGRDVMDFSLDVAPGDEISAGVLTFSDQSQQVSGTLQDQTGRPAPDYTIIVFATDKRYWLPQTRRIRTTRPGTDGKFTVTNLPAGEYRLAAVVDIAAGDANDPAFLEQLMQASVPVTLAEGDRKVQDLRIAGGP